MAGTNKEVDLIIRAKNAASKELDAVSSSLKGMSQAQDNASKSAKGFDGLLHTLGSDLRKLDQELKGLNALNKVSSEVDRAQAALGRLESALATSTDDFNKNKTALAEATAAHAKHTAAVERNASALATQKAALSLARDQQRQANTEYAKAERTLERVTAATYKAAAGGPLTENASAALTRLEAESKAAKLQADTAAGTVKTLSAGMERLTDERVKASAANRQAAAQERELSAAVAKTTAALESEKAAVAEGRAVFAELQQAANAAAAQVNQVGASQDQLAAATNKVTAELKQEKAVLDALARYSTGNAQAPAFADPQTAAKIRATRVEMEAAKTSQQTLQAEIAKLAAQMKNSATATDSQVAALARAKSAASAAKQEYLALQAQLASLQGSAQSTFQALNKIDGGLRAIRPIQNPVPPPPKGWGQFFEEMAAGLSSSEGTMGRITKGVLAMTAAYVGFYQAVQGVSAVIDTYKMLEAAQNRLGAIFGQNKQAVATELQWVQRQADRLALSFGSLADQYSKFAISANAANVSSQGSKEIFLAVAEAARVNKLSTEQTSRVFLAFTQMLNKGKIQGEELTQQLGELLPGATITFAKALGLTTQQLTALMEKGQVFSSENALLKVAQQLRKMYGDQLAESLKSTTSLIEQFWNSIQQGQLIIANSGFIDAFNKLLSDMNNYFRSDEGRKFFMQIGAAMTTATNAARTLFNNFGLLIDAVKVLIALAIASWVRSAIAALVAFTASTLSAEAATAFLNRTLVMQLLISLRGLGAMLLGTVASLRTAAAAMITMATSVTTLGEALAFVGTMLSRIPALLVIGGLAYGVMSLFSDWTTGISKATEAADGHDAVMKKVLARYDEVKGKTDDWAASLGKNEKSQLLENVQEQYRKTKLAFEDLYATMKDASVNGGGMGTWRFWDTEFNDIAVKVRKLKSQLTDSLPSIKNYRDELAKIYNNTNNAQAREQLESLMKIADQAIINKKNTGELAVAGRDLGSAWLDMAKDADAAGTSVQALSGYLNNAAAATDTAADAARRYQAVLNNVMGMIPKYQGMVRQAKAQEELNSLKAQAEQERGGATPEKIAEMEARIAEAQKVVNSYGLSTKVATATGQQGDDYREFAQSMSYSAAQLGIASKDLIQGAVTLTNGKVSKQDLIDAFKVSGVTAEDSWTKISAAITTGLKGAGVTTGTNTIGVIAAGQNGNAKTVTDNGENNTQAAKDAIKAFNEGELEAKALTEAILDTEKEFAAAGQKAGEAQARTNARLEESHAEVDGLTAQTPELKKQLFIKQQMAAVDKENPNITKEQRDELQKNYEKLYDLRQATKGNKEENKAIREVMREVNNLESARNDLLQVRKYYEETGQLDKMKQTDQKLAEINAKLTESIDKAIGMWKAIGGSEAEAAIAKLEATKTKITEVGQKSKWTGQQMNESLANGLTNAIDTFFSALEEGETVIGALRKAFLKFASDFLLEIGKMIVKQALLNALQMGQGANGGVGGFIAGAIGALFHTGGVVGATPSARSNRGVAASTFAGAARYHEGGVAGLQPGEIPAILERGEVVDPGDGSVFNKVFGGKGQAQAPAPNIKIVNAIDSGSFVQEGLNTDVGQEAMMNWMRANSSVVKQTLG